MKVVLLALLIVSITSADRSKLSAETHEKFFGSQLRKTNIEQGNVWIFFSDKGPPNNRYVKISEKALLRRKKMNMGLTEEDIPVNHKYVDKIKQLAIDCTVRSTSNWLNAISVTGIRAEQLDKITELPFVRRIEMVAQYKRVDPVTINSPSNEGRQRLNYGRSYTQLNQIKVIDAQNMGYTGQNVTIAVLDSGFRTTHVAFRNIRVLATYDFVKNDSNVDNEPGDPPEQFHHGTQVLSVLAAIDDGNFYGASFGASYLLAKTETIAEEVITEEDNFARAVEWAENLGADILSSSLGYRDWWGPQGYDGLTSIATRAINVAIEKGMSCIISAGNDGPLGLSVPADAFYAISVGSVDSNNRLSSFSAHGPTSDGRIKPEVVAMGTSTHVVDPLSTTGYKTNSGTSFSAPLVAGAVAILQSAHPDWNPIDIREALLKTALNANSPNNQIGWGLVDTVKAINYAPRNESEPVIDCDCSSHGICVNGSCKCYAGYVGKTCSTLKQVCGYNNCNNGFCFMNKCECYQGWSGTICDRKSPVSPASIISQWLWSSYVLIMLLFLL